ncbi:hypothetical protein [Dactylococcopsis salina]|nr:hypothetical protein [Dactylococcopsis salina]
MVISHWSLITDYWSLITDYWSLITDYWSLITVGFRGTPPNLLLLNG